MGHRASGENYPPVYWTATGGLRSDDAQGLAERGIATLRYQFLYMEKGSKRPDAPKLAHAVVRAAAAEAVRLVPDLPLFAGGRSYGHLSPVSLTM